MALIVSTFAGDEADAGGVGSLVDGTGPAAHFYAPAMLTYHDGKLWVCDSENHAIRTITVPGAVVETVAGTGVAGSADGDALTTAQFQPVQGIGFDSAGDCYIVDTGNNRIRKLTISTNVVSTVAGSTSGYFDGTGPAARFSSPNGVAIDGSDNLYVADVGNHVIRKITPAGVVTTIAGQPGMFGTTDGDAATTALFRNPSDVVFGTDGLLYICDESNGLIRSLDFATNLVATVSTAVSLPAAICRYGDDFLVANIDHDIWRITAAGGATVFAGTGVLGLVNGPTATAQFNDPLGVFAVSTADVYVGDYNNNVIRRIAPVDTGRPRARGRHVPHPVRARGRERGVNPAAPRARGRQAT